MTGEDLASRAELSPYFGPVFRDQPILAIGKVRFVGEPVVAVAAVDLDAADEAIELIDVEYEELPAVFDSTPPWRPTRRSSTRSRPGPARHSPT